MKQAYESSFVVYLRRATTHSVQTDKNKKNDTWNIVYTRSRRRHFKNWNCFAPKVSGGAIWGCATGRVQVGGGGLARKAKWAQVSTPRISTSSIYLYTSLVSIYIYNWYRNGNGCKYSYSYGYRYRYSRTGTGIDTDTATSVSFVLRLNIWISNLFFIWARFFFCFSWVRLCLRLPNWLFYGAGFVNRCFALIENNFLIVAPINLWPLPLIEIAFGAWESRKLWIYLPMRWIDLISQLVSRVLQVVILLLVDVIIWRGIALVIEHI